MIHLHWLDYTVIGIYFLIVFLIGFFVKGAKSGDKLTEYFLAGRKITLPIFVATLVSTWYGNLLGVTQIAYSHGLVTWLTQGFFWYAVYIFFAFYLAPKIHDAKLFTIPDLMEKFYGRYSAIATAVINIIMLNPALYILSTGIMFEIVFGIDTFTGILIGTIVPLIYTFKGGFKAVVYTDFVQFIFMFTGLALIIPFALWKHGGLAPLAHVPESHYSLTGEWSWQVILAWFLISLWAIVDSNFYQRTNSAQNVKTAQSGVLIATVFWFIFDMMVNFIGIYAFAVNPDLDPVKSLPFFADSVLPPFLKGIFFTGLIATIMSTFDSLIFASSMAFSKDIFARLGAKKEDDKVIFINKICIVVVVVAAFLIALQCKSLMNFVYARGSIGISALLLPVLAGFVTEKKFSDKTITASIILGGTTALAMFLLKEFYKISFVEPIIAGLLISALFLLYKRFRVLK